jgi:spore germination cell wall hydrolase CwlJ-like protein
MSVQWGGVGRRAAYGLAAVSFMCAASALAYFSLAPAGDDKGFFAGPGISLARKIGPVRMAAPVGPEVVHLFSYEGKNDRADYVAAQIAIARQTLQENDDAVAALKQESAGKAGAPQGEVSLMTASLTPLDFSRPGPTRAAGAFQQSVNRGGKTDRIGQPSMDIAADTPPPAIPASLSPEPAPSPQTASLSESDEGISAALFLLSPSPGEPQPQADTQVAVATTAGTQQTSASGQGTWDDLIKLARVTGGDGEKIPSGIFGALSEKEFRAREFRCMATAIYFESRGESVKGQTAVGQVIMTRVRSDYYPNTICGVVYQGQWNRNACQFSFACDGEPDAPKNRQQWATAIDVAKKVISGQGYLKEIGDATHYHATYVSPDWRKMMTKVAKVGVHVFYKAPFVRPLVANNESNPL